MKLDGGLSGTQADASSMEVIPAKAPATAPGFVLVPTEEMARLRELETDVGAHIERVEGAAREAIRRAEDAAEEAKEEIASLVFAAAFEAACSAGRVSELDRDGLRELFKTDRAAAMTALEINWRKAQ